MIIKLSLKFVKIPVWIRLLHNVKTPKEAKNVFWWHLAVFMLFFQRKEVGRLLFAVLGLSFHSTFDGKWRSEYYSKGWLYVYDQLWFPLNLSYTNTMTDFLIQKMIKHNMLGIAVRGSIRVTMLNKNWTDKNKFWPANLFFMNSSWYIVETNYDLWTNPPASDNRRDAAIKAMNAVGQANMTANALVEVSFWLCGYVPYYSAYNPMRLFLK